MLELAEPELEPAVEPPPPEAADKPLEPVAIEAPAEPAPLPASQPNGEPPRHALQEPEEAGCVWEVWLPGHAASTRCGAPVAPGRPWCAWHAQAFALGKALRGRMPRRVGMLRPIHAVG